MTSSKDGEELSYGARQAILKPYANLYAHMLHIIEAAPNADLAALLAACRQVSPTNCWFAEYHAGKIVEPLATAEIARRSDLQDGGGK